MSSEWNEVEKYLNSHVFVIDWMDWKRIGQQSRSMHLKTIELRFTIEIGFMGIFVLRFT